MKAKVASLFFISLFITSCIDKPEDIEILIEEAELSFPDGFDFSTSKQITINITDNTQSVIYEINYEIDGQRQVLGKYNRLGRETAISIRIPSTTDELEIVQISANSENSFPYEVSGLIIEADLTNNNSRRLASTAFSTNADCIDRLYAVESSNRGFWSIDLTTSDYNETTLTRWVKLNDLNFEVVNVPVEVKFINKLNSCQSSNFRKYSVFETTERFGIVPSDHELIA